MAADMRSNVWHLHLENAVIPSHHMVESMFPMHGYKRFSVIINTKESCVSIKHFFKFHLRSIFNYSSNALRHIILDWELPCSGIGFGIKCNRANVLTNELCIQIFFFCLLVCIIYVRRCNINTGNIIPTSGKLQ